MMSEHGKNQAEGKARQKASRLLAVDALRGLIIALMALDHANFFVGQNHPASEMWGGRFPVYSDALAFLTRLVTHLAAPGFFFLMGIGMLLFAHSRQARGWSRWAIIRHFVIRGALLIALQLLIVNRAWELSPTGWEVEIYVGVLFALGGTMIVGSLLLWLRPIYLLALTALLFVGVEFLHPGPGMWNTIQHDPANLILLRPGGEASLWSNYPVLPWLELVTFGLVFGHWLGDDARGAFSRAWKLGAAFLLAFVVVRYLDGFGNIRPRMGDTWIDFLNPVKYPPSMTFTLMTMGANLILLSVFSRAGAGARRFLETLAVFGRAPLFFYLLHLFLYAGIGYLLTPNGTTIPLVYPLWLLGLLVLFPLCLWYGGFKQRQPPGSVLRFL
jgi:uncharacterized membrane protein